MSNDKDINININTKATGDGVKKTTEEIKKLDDAGKAAKGLKAIGEGGSEADKELLKLQDRLVSLRKRAGELREEAGELEDGFEDAGEAGDGMAEDLKKIKRVQLAQSMGKLAGDLAKVGGQLKRAGGDMRKFDEDTGVMLETIGEGTEKIGGFVEAGLKGFAAGGPLGAALGLTIKSFGEIATSIEKAARISATVSGQVTTDWKLNKKALDEVKASVDLYSEAIRQASSAHDEEMRQLGAKLSLQRQLREVQLELSGRENDAEILRINNSDLGEAEKRERIAALRLEHLRKQQEAERKGLDDDIQAKEAALAKLIQKEAQAVKALKQAEELAATYNPEKQGNKKSVQEGLLKSLAEQTRGLSSSLLSGGPVGDTGVGFLGDLAGSRGIFGPVAELLEKGGYSKVQPGDLGNEKAINNLRTLAEDTLAAVAEDRERSTGASDDDLDKFEQKAQNILKIIELSKKGDAELQAEVAAAIAANAKLEAAKKRLEEASTQRDDQDDGLAADIEAAKQKRSALPAVQQKEFQARDEDFNVQVNRAAQREAQSSGSNVVKEVQELGNDVVQTLESSGAAKEVIAKAREDAKAANKLVADAFKDGIIDAGESQKITAAVEGFRRQQQSVNQSVINALAEATSAIAANQKTIEGLRGQLRTVSSTILSR